MTEQEELEKKFLIIYPTQNELRETDERFATAMHNYCCIGQAQVYIRKVRTKYSICTRGWRGGNWHYKGGYMEVSRVDTLREAKKIYLETVKKLVEEEYKKWVAFSLSAWKSTEKESKHRAEIARIVEQCESKTP